MIEYEKSNVCSELTFGKGGEMENMKNEFKNALQRRLNAVRGEEKVATCSISCGEGITYFGTIGLDSIIFSEDEICIDAKDGNHLTLALPYFSQFHIYDDYDNATSYAMVQNLDDEEIMVELTVQGTENNFTDIGGTHLC